MEKNKWSMSPAAVVEDKQQPVKKPAAVSGNSVNRPATQLHQSPVSDMLRSKNGPQNVEKRPKDSLTDIRPSSSRSDTPDQENRLKQRSVKKEATSREASVGSSVSSGKPKGRGRPPKKANTTKRKIESSDEDDDEIIAKPRRKRAKTPRRDGDYDRISDKWDEYRKVCTTMTSQDLEILSGHVGKVFEEVKKDYEDNVRVKAMNSFENSLKNLHTRRSYKLANNDEPVAMVLREPTKHRFASKGELPRMRYFIHVESNLLVSDRLRLSHIPYVEEGQDDFDWVGDLRRHFTEGIHGADRGIDQYINDYLLERLLSTLETHRLHYTMKDVNFAIFTMFPNKHSFRELNNPHFHPRLKIRFGAPKPIAGVTEGPVAIANAMCSRDGQFGCMTHIKLPESILPVRVSKNSTKADFVPCGRECGYVSLFDRSSPNEDVVSSLQNSALCSFIENLFKNSHVLVCKATLMTNRMLVKAGLPPRTCSEFAQLAKKKAADAIVAGSETTKKIPSERERHNMFRSRFKNNIDNSKPFNPCDHEGECHLPDSHCECYQNNSPCTPHCKCGTTCSVLFPGCRCTPGQCRTDLCPCFRARWECDPANCAKCQPNPSGADDKCCGNIGIQQNLKKKIRVGVSLIAGFGCFLMEDVAKGDLISEYTGEVISDSETERRGSIQDRMKLSYVFTLNSKQSIDAGRMGNIIRFANHSNSPNCEAKTMMVDGVQRIGIYAKMAIPKGEEIFFDYRYKSDQKELYVNVKHPSQKNGKQRKRKND